VPHSFDYLVIIARIEVLGEGLVPVQGVVL